MLSVSISGKKLVLLLTITVDSRGGSLLHFVYKSNSAFGTLLLQVLMFDFDFNKSLMYFIQVLKTSMHSVQAADA